MIGLIFIAAAIAVALWYYSIRPLRYWENMGVKQSKPWPFMGDSWMTFLRHMSFNDFVSYIYNYHPGTRYSGIYNFNSPVLVIKDPELIKQITVKDFEHFTDHPPFVDPDADPLWSNALLSLKGERWKEMRNTLSPTFTSKKIKTIYVLMLETAENFVKHFLEQKDEIIEFEMKDAYSRFTNDIIATTAFGVQVNSLKNRTNDFYEMGKKLTNFKGILNLFKFLGHQVFPKLFKNLNIPFLDKQASKYFYTVINDTIKAREEQNIVRHDMINLMLEARKEKDQTNGKSKTVKISNQEITSQAMIFFFAGFDTVSTAICFGSYELALNKEIQDRLREEIMETQKDGKVTYDDLILMKYMDMVVSEILRKWPPFPQLDRLCTKQYTIEPVHPDEKPVTIFPGQEIWIPSYGIQRDPQYFPNPDKFDPERFSEENKNNIVPYTFMTFGVGPRICIGKSKTVQISNEEITSQAMIFFFAGFETVSTAVCSASYELALNKDIQDRLREEIMKTQKDGKVIYEDLMQIKYLDMVISENLRKWPPFPALDRICTKQYTIEPVSKDENPVTIFPGQEV